MKRLVILFGLLIISGLLAACSSGGGDDSDNVLPMEVQFVAASPNAGTQPLRSVMTAVITGGKAPFYYAWDYTNDGAPDAFDSGQYSRTVNTVHEYFTRVSDGAEDSVYEVGFTVTDSEGTIVTADPINVTVFATGGLSVDPLGTGWTTDADDGQAHSSEPIQFRIAAVGGRAPYTYEWDFNDDGATDSRIANPQHTFYYDGPKSFEIFPVTVLISDADGQELAVRDEHGNLLISDNVFRVAVAAPGYDFNDDQGFAITLSSHPSATDGVIELKFDPSQAEPGAIPLEPELDLSVIVDPLVGGGVQPYEYYWDFDNDGAIETQAPSPTIPFYDFDRKILMNPYKHSLNTKTFTLRCMVIDGAGQIANAYRTVVVQNTKSSVDLQVVPTYGVLLGDGSIGSPYASISDQNGNSDLRDELTDVVFNFTVSGSTGVYDFQFDANGDDIPEIPAGGGFQPVSGNQITIDSTTLASFQGAGYFPAQITVRSLQNGAPSQTVIKNVPVSIVGRRPMGYEGAPLEVRVGHSVEATWTVVAGGGNTQYLGAREMIIAGGAVGNTPLRNMEKVIETFGAPAVAGEIEESEEIYARIGKPLLTPRRGAMIWTEDSSYYIHGGESESDMIEASVEVIPINDADGTEPWARLNEMVTYFPLKFGMGTRVTDVDNTILPYDMFGQSADKYDALVFCGGITKPENGNTETNSSIYIYRSQIWPDGNPMQAPQPDGYTNIGYPMITPRHEGCAVWDPSGRMFYVIGGRTADGGSTANVEVFDLDTKFWDNLPPMNFARAGATAEFIGGKIYIMGGSNYPEDEGQQVLLETAEVYNPDTEVWTLTVPPSVPTHQPSSAALPGPGSVSDQGVNVNTLWYFGGSTTIGETNFFEEFVYFQDVPIAAGT